MLNERQRNLLSYLYKLERSCTVDEITTYFNMSERTIRNDIKLIRMWGKENQVPIHFKNSILFIDEKERHLLESLLNVREDLESNSNSPLTRQLYITLRLLMSDEFVSLNEIAEQFNTSKSTIATDMKAVSDWLQKLRIPVTSSKQGYLIEIEELPRRLAMINVIEWLEYSQKSFAQYKYISWQNLTHKDIQKFDKYFYDFQPPFEKIDIPLYACLLVQFERLKNKSYLNEINVPTHLTNNVDINCLSNFYENFNIDVPENEKSYMQIVSLLYNRDFEIHSEAHTNSIKDFIDHIKEVLGLGKISDETWNLLVSELMHLLIWQQFSIYRYNPMFTVTYTKYRVIYHMIESLQEQLVEWIAIPQYMWTEIVLLIAGELEHQQRENDNLRVILVCPNGSASSYFLEKRLQRYFPTLEIVAKFSVEQLKLNTSIQYDFIISTVLLNEMTERVIVIQPFLDEKQLELIQGYIHKYEQQKISSQHLVESVIPTENVNWLHSVQSIEHLMLEGIRILKNKGIANIQVERDLMDIYYKFGMYFEIMPGLIMPHIISRDVAEVGISCICLEQPLHINGKRIYTAITLVSPNEKGHVPLINHLYNLLSKTKTVQELNLLLEKRSATYDT